MSLSEILKILLTGYPVPPEMLDSRIPLFLQTIGGLQLSITITILSLVIGTAAGFVLSLFTSGTRRKIRLTGKPGEKFRLVLRWTSIIFIEVIRAVPVIILVLLVFYLPYRLFGLRLPPVMLAIFIFSIYAGVYLSEVFRSGFRAVDKRWIDAARILGLSRFQILTKVKLPIALRAMIPSFLNIVITVFKDTSVLVVVAVPEITYTGRLMQAANPANYAMVLFMIMTLYWMISSSGSAVSYHLENRWSKNLAANIK